MEWDQVEMEWKCHGTDEPMHRVKISILLLYEGGKEEV